MERYYQNHALGLFNNGYKPIPIKPSTKIPFMGKGESWQVDINKEQVEEWAANGKGAGGIALTGLCGIDCDVKNRPVSDKLVKYIRENISDKSLIRIGLAPKFLVPASPISAIHKKYKNTWYDKNGDKHEIEFLSPGDQYFLAFGIHPDTGKPFRWVGDKSPLKVKVDDLKEWEDLDIAGFEDYFDGLAKEAGWTREGKSKKSKSGKKKNDGISDSLENYKPPGGADLSELKKYLLLLPQSYCDDREDWIRIGSAIHHGSGGSADGFELFDAWSQTSSNYTGSKDTFGRWKSFNIEKSGDDCATIGSIVHILKEEGLYEGAKETATQNYESRVQRATDKESIRSLMKEIKKDKSLDALSRSDLALEIKNKIKALGGGWKLPDILKQVTPKYSKDTTPIDDPWLSGWVFLSNQNMFAKCGEPSMVKRASFNGMYNRHLSDRTDLDGKHQEADRYALEIKKIDYVHDLMYYPMMPERFEFERQLMINSFNPDSFGERKPESEWDELDHKAIDLFKNHLYEMFPQDGEADLLLETMAHIVQNPQKRLLWALVIYGCEGDGKTTLCEVLSRAVGSINSGIVNGSDIVSGVFSDWAEGQIVKIIEELKVPGKNRFDTIEKIKTFITNNVISINPKWQVPKKVPNTASIITTTNHRDAIPYQDDSRRFTLISSKWRSKQQILDKYGKSYFDKLITVFIKHETALNEFLATYNISEDFSPYSLPVTPSLLGGIHNEKSDLIIVIEDIIYQGKYSEINDNVIILKKLRDVIQQLNDFGDIELEDFPTMGETKRALKKLKYSQSIKQHTIDGKGTRIWLKDIKETRGNIIEKIASKTDKIEIVGDIF